ncbi:MAG: hypothetical protein IIW14_03775 [Kiritimatiellae bacterium]|nr:hypothetical protein [Kiritimatiellia bacterium]
MSNPKTNPFSIIRCGNADDAYLAYMAMFRYAFGRMTYMPDVVIEIIKRNEKYLTDRVLMSLNTELAEEAARYERRYKDTPNCGGNYGMECDRQSWLAFHAWVREQIAKRKDMEGDAQ